MKTRKSWIVAPILVGGLLYVTSNVWMPWLGTALVSAAEPVKADAVVVLAGDWRGRRVEKGGELVKAGYAPVAYISGPKHYYGVAEADLAIAWAVSKGYQKEYFVPVPADSTSTEDESVALAGELRKIGGIHKILLVTSNYHTGRAGRIWRRTAGRDFDVHVVAAPDADLSPETWWATREGRKKIFFEWIKTVTGPLGL